MLERAAELRRPLGVSAFRQLWFAQLVSELGDWAARLALSVLVYNRTGSPGLVGLATAATLLAWLGPGQLITAASERWPRRRVMVGSDLVRASVFAVVALVSAMPVWLLLALVFCAGLATPPFEGARSALRPEVLPPPLYPAAVALSGMTQDLSVAVGYLAGGALVAAVGPEPALLINAASFALSALLLAGLPRARAARSSGEPGGVRAAARVLTGDPVIMRAAGLVVVAMLAATGLIAMSAPLVLDSLAKGPAVVGGLVAIATVISMIVTPMVTEDRPTPVLMRRTALLTVSGGALVTGSFALLSAGAAAGLPLTVLGFAGVGLLLSVLAPANVVVVPRLPRGLRAAGLSVLMGSLAATEAVSASLAGLVATKVGLPLVCLGLGVPALAGGAWALVRQPGVAGAHRRP